MSKQIRLGSHAGAAKKATDLVVIIDVFRAFTTAAFALANGAEKIVMVADLASALNLREEGIGHFCMGERGGDRPDGFDFGNSPAEIKDVRFDGKTLIQTTSNGTRGVIAASAAKEIYTGAFVNAAATVEAIRRSAQNDITIVAMGDGDERADEDEMCALYLRSRLTGLEPDALAVKTTLKTMSKRLDGRALSEEDFESCLSIDQFPFAIRVRQESGYWIARAEML